MTTATATPFSIDPGMHPRIDERVMHNLDIEAPLQPVARVVLAAQQARDMVASLTGAVRLTVRDDEHGPLADVQLYSGDPLAYVRDARTGWSFTVGTYEHDDDGELVVHVVLTSEG